MKRCVAILVALLLAGCASSVRWVKAGATPADFEQDKIVCKYEATKATASGGNFGYSSAVGAGLAEGFKQLELMQLCLQARGWAMERIQS